MKKKILNLSVVFIAALMFVTQAPSAFAVNKEAATALYNQGIDYYKNNDIPKSIETFKKAIIENPKFYEAYYNLAKIQSTYGYNDDAIASYEAIILIMPEDFESMYELGMLLYKRGYLKKSLTYLDRIPDYSEYYEKAQKIVPVIEKRQAEVAREAKIKENAAKRSTVLSTIVSASGVAVDTLGNIYVASYSQNQVYKITPQGVKTVFVGNTVLGGPIGLAMDKDNNLYIANFTKGNIVKASPAGKADVLLYVAKPYCISVDNQNSQLLITEQDKNTVIKFDISTEAPSIPTAEVPAVNTAAKAVAATNVSNVTSNSSKNLNSDSLIRQNTKY